MLGKLRQDYTPIPVRAFQAPTHLTGDLSAAIAAPSPARALQEKLEFSTGVSLDEKWSPRRSLALIIVSASTLWLAVIAAAGGAMHAIV